MAKRKNITKGQMRSAGEQVLPGATGTNTSDPIPPGATRGAFDRPENPEHGTPASGAGELHAVGEAGGGNLVTGLVGNDDGDTPTGRHPEDERDEAAYGGIAGGAVGGTPAEGRSVGGHVHGGIAPGGVHRGDSTVGSRPDKARGAPGKRKKRS
jgi:hypothetical protein